ncbi:microcephalin isoform X2 [Agrilus planipennis]|uniref:Microcephalin isoform X2 n=1 Tax=Agrilus planipennis TaxID=224129 RepID=A0A1W4X329_AGRPL|nr:microcephalin isoform X2 [Agrilus planipennis]
MDFNRRKRRTSSVLLESDILDRNRGKMQFQCSSSFITDKGTSDRKINDDLISNLIQDSEKRALLLRLLTQGKETISKNKKALQFDGNPEENFTPKKVKNKPRFESPSALWKRRAKEKQQASETSSVSSDQLPPIVASPTVPFDKLLDGVIGFVELKCGAENKSLGAKNLMIAMGAEVRDTFTKDVTHVVFKDGTFNTYYKAKLLKIHLVSVLWLDAIKTTGIRVPEQKFPALGFSSRDHNLSKICLDFQNDYEEMIQDEFEKTLALSTEILSQSFNSDFVTKRKSTFNKKNVNVSSSSEENSTNTDPNNLNCIPQSNKQLSTENWLLNISNSSPSDQLDDSSISLSDVESDCGMVDGCSVKRSKELQKLNQSVSNSIFEIDRLIETTYNVRDTFNKSELGNLLLNEDKELNVQKLHSRGTHSTSTSESKSLLTGRNLRRSSRISACSGSKSSNATEQLSSLRLSTDTQQKGKSNTTNLENSNKAGSSEGKGDNRISNVSSTMSSLRISSATSNSKNDYSISRTCKELESEKSSEKLKRSRNNRKVINLTLNEKKLHEMNESRNVNVKSKKNSSFKSSILNSDINLTSKKTCNVQTNSSNKAETQLNNIKNPTNQLFNETESSSDLSFTNTMSQNKKKRRKLFNPDEFLLKEGNAENEDVLKRRRTLDKVLEVKQPTVSFNSTVLMENINKNKVNVISSQGDENQTKKKLGISKTKSNECQENILPIKRKNLDKKDSHSPKSETDSSPMKHPNQTKEKLIRDLARRSLRIQTKKLTQKGSVATPQDSKRRSSYDFVPKGKTLSQIKVKKLIKNKKSSIVCTRLHSPDVQTFMQIVKKLGTFYTEDEVSEKTTHLVAGEPRRTINILRALARGCWILKIEWLYKSLEVGRWVEEEDYELTEFSPAVQCRQQRQAFGSLYSMDIFQNIGPIFVSNASVPRRSDLEELIVLCKGTITKTMSSASVIVAEITNMKQKVCVSEKWILDSVMYNTKKPFKNYLLKLNIRESQEF